MPLQFFSKLADSWVGLYNAVNELEGEIFFRLASIATSLSDAFDKLFDKIISDRIKTPVLNGVIFLEILLLLASIAIVIPMAFSLVISISSVVVAPMFFFLALMGSAVAAFNLPIAMALLFISVALLIGVVVLSVISLSLVFNIKSNLLRLNEEQQNQGKKLQLLQRLVLKLPGRNFEAKAKIFSHVAIPCLACCLLPLTLYLSFCGFVFSPPSLAVLAVIAVCVQPPLLLAVFFGIPFITKNIYNRLVFQREFNYSQSTHTASINASSSDIATRLSSFYQSRRLDKRERKKIFKDMKNAIKNEGGINKKICNRAIKSLKGTYYVDSKSKTSVKKFTMLVWLAIDDKKEKEEYANALKMFIDICGTIIDAGGQPICSAGRFNKLAEVMKCVDPEKYELPYVTRRGASLKLPCVVNEELLIYLEKNPKDVAAVLNNDVSEIYPMIRDNVFNRIKEEFGSAFEGDSVALSSVVDAGEYAELTEKTKAALEEVQGQRGYNAF